MQDPQPAKALSNADAALRSIPNGAILYKIDTEVIDKNSIKTETYLSYKIDKTEPNYINIIAYLCDKNMISTCKTASDLETYAHSKNLEVVSLSIPLHRIVKIQNLNYKSKTKM